MSTLWQKFPGVSDIEKKVVTYPVAARFTAPLVAGKFVYNRLTVPAFSASAGEMLVLDGVVLAGNIDQLIFANAIDPTSNDGFFSLDIVRRGNNHPVTLQPFKFGAFSQGGEFSVNWAPTATEKGTEQFDFVLSGGLIQTPEIVALGKSGSTCI